MITFLYTFALRDFLRVRRLLAWIFVVGVLFGIVKLVAIVSREPDGVKTYLRLADLFLFRVLALASAIISTAVVSAEIEQKTIVYLLTRPIPRWQLLLGRTFAAMTMCVIVGIMAGSALAVASMGVSGLGHNYFHRDILGIVVGSVFYTSFFVLLSLWINRSMIVNLLYAFGAETIFGNMPGDLKMLSIGYYLEVLSRRPSVTTGNQMQDAMNSLMVSTLTPQMAWLATLVGVVACLVISSLWFSTHEYLPREDIE